MPGNFDEAIGNAFRGCGAGLTAGVLGHGLEARRIGEQSAQVFKEQIGLTG